jgi:hypothetical protein
MKTFAELERDVVDAALIRHDVMKTDVFKKTPVADAQLYAACEALRKDDIRVGEAFSRGAKKEWK